MIKFRVCEQDRIFEADQFFPQCHASTLTALENGEILSAWFAGTHEKHADVSIWTARRVGNNWEEPKKAAHGKGVPCWNPVLFTGDKGEIYLYYKVGKTIPDWHTMVMVSQDNGISWSDPKELVTGDVGGRGPVKNKPIRLEKGDWLAPASIETESAWDAFVDISRDGGHTWHKSGMVPIDHNLLNGKGIIQPCLWESKPGFVHMLLRSTEGCLYRSDSKNGGKTWCKAYWTDLPNNNSGLDIVKTGKEVLVLVYNPVRGNWAERTPIVCRISTDNGETWEEEFCLEHKKSFEFSYPAIIAGGNFVYITYTWNRKSIAFWKLQIECM